MRELLQQSHTVERKIEDNAYILYAHKSNTIYEGLRERTEYIDVFIFLRPSLNRVLFPMFCLLVEGGVSDFSVLKYY